MRRLRRRPDRRLAVAHVGNCARRTHRRVRLHRPVELGGDLLRRRQRLRAASPFFTSDSLPSNGPARSHSRTPASPMSELESVQRARSTRAAAIASHSSGATTARKSSMRTTRAPGIDSIDAASTPSSFAPTAGGRTTRACSIPSILKSCMYTCRPVTLPGMSGRASGLPTTLYDAGSRSFALASTLIAKRRSPISSAKRSTVPPDFACTAPSATSKSAARGRCALPPWRSALRAPSRPPGVSARRRA